MKFTHVESNVEASRYRGGSAVKTCNIAFGRMILVFNVPSTCLPSLHYGLLFTQTMRTIWTFLFSNSYALKRTQIADKPIARKDNKEVLPELLPPSVAATGAVELISASASPIMDPSKPSIVFARSFSESSKNNVSTTANKNLLAAAAVPCINSAVE